MPSESSKNKKPLLIDYRTKSYSGERLQGLPLYEPEVKQSLHKQYPVIFGQSFLTDCHYSFDPFNQTEVKWSQFAKEWWLASFKKLLQNKQK